MKRYLGIVLAALFVFGFAASAFAIHAEIPSETQAVVAKGGTQITLGGELRFRGEYKKNTDVDKNDDGDNLAAYDARVRLRLQADVSKNTTGVIHIEAGNNTIKDTYTWGDGGSEDAGVYNVGNGKRGQFNVLEAWILHKFDIGVPAGIKVGHMPLALGNKLFFNHTKFGDDAIVFFMDPTKELHVGLLTIKMNEGENKNDSHNNDDADAYVGLFAYKGKDFNLSGDVTYVDDKTFLGAKATHLTNYGLRGDIAFGSLNIMADGEIQSGKIRFTGGNDISLRGKAFMVGASYKVAPATIRAKYGYGSGDNDSTDNKNNVFVTAVPDTQNFTYVYDYRVNGATGEKHRGIANTTFVNLGVTADLTKDLNASLDYYVLRASKKNKLNGTALTSKKMGTELDAKVTYKLDKNLVYFVEGGYLWTGTGYDTATIKADDAYAVRHGITLSF